MRTFHMLLAVLLTVPPLSAGAEHNCPGTTSMAMIECAVQDWRTADAELNRLWKVLKPRADARGTGQSLLAEQRRWLQRRDAHCEPELHHGGSLDRALYYSCMAAMTRSRNDQFRSMLR
ncbi:lysozyme inhibitor LprI family protein [Roseivivax sp. CAU 1761]